MIRLPKDVFAAALNFCVKKGYHKNTGFGKVWVERKEGKVYVYATNFYSLFMATFPAQKEWRGEDMTVAISARDLRKLLYKDETEKLISVKHIAGDTYLLWRDNLRLWVDMECEDGFPDVHETMQTERVRERRENAVAVNTAMMLEVSKALNLLARGGAVLVEHRGARESIYISAEIMSAVDYSAEVVLMPARMG